MNQEVPVSMIAVQQTKHGDDDTTARDPSCSSLFTFNGGETQCTQTCDCGGTVCVADAMYPQYCRSDNTVSYYPHCSNQVGWNASASENQCAERCNCGDGGPWTHAGVVMPTGGGNCKPYRAYDGYC